MRERLVAGLLLVVGLLQIAGDLSGLTPMRALGAAWGASPAPKVFSVARGLETYSTRFFLEWRDKRGEQHSLRLTPELYSRLRGPYNRRNVYGAVLAYGPILSTDPRTKPLFDSVSRYALCGEAPLLRELGVDPLAVAGALRLRLEPRDGTPPEIPRVLEPQCP